MAPVVVGEGVALGGLVTTEIIKLGALETAEQVGIQAAKQAAQQAAIKTAQQSATNSILAGVASFGWGLGIQGVLSIASSYLSSDWLVKPQYYDDGTAESGIRPQ